MDKGLNQYPMGVNKKYDAEVYRTLGFSPDDETGEPIPGMSTTIDDVKKL
ncbi:MAG: hypothetical protein FWF80_03695 [Defluviitaleaceae bacterium]|nr:hypothetical protein [Defluviitaleaceae bacterium]